MAKTFPSRKLSSHSVDEYITDIPVVRTFFRDAICDPLYPYFSLRGVRWVLICQAVEMKVRMVLAWASRDWNVGYLAWESDNPQGLPSPQHNG